MNHSVFAIDLHLCEANSQNFFVTFQLGGESMVAVRSSFNIRLLKVHVSDSCLLSYKKRIFFFLFHFLTSTIWHLPLDHRMLEANQDICRLLNADRLTLYVVNEDGSAIVSRVKTGLNSSQELKLPINARSIAGFVALTRQTINLWPTA